MTGESLLLLLGAVGMAVVLALTFFLIPEIRDIVILSLEAGVR